MFWSTKKICGWSNDLMMFEFEAKKESDVNLRNIVDDEFVVSTSCTKASGSSFATRNNHINRDLFVSFWIRCSHSQSWWIIFVSHDINLVDFVFTEKNKGLPFVQSVPGGAFSMYWSLFNSFCFPRATSANNITA